VFTEEIVKEVGRNSEKPLIFTFSNPTSKCECTAEQAFKWTEGRCIYASASIFPPVECNGKLCYPQQGNNMYIYPGLSFGASLCKARKVSNGMITAATKTLASLTTDEELSGGRIYPNLNKIREISSHVAASVIEQAVKEGVARESVRFSVDRMYNAQYEDLVE